MRYAIVRMFASSEQAHAAARDLRADGFEDDTVFVVTPSTAGENASHETTTAVIMAAYVLRAHARVYAEGVQQGRSLVAVHAAFGLSQRAIDIMAAHDPVDSGLRLASEPGPGWDDAAPMSSALRMPPLLRNSPAPLSSMWGLPTLSRGRSGALSLLFGELTRSTWTFSGLFGMGLLSRNPAPLSSMLGLKTVKARPGDWRSSFGLPLLSSRR
jgi:hypothetical protein